MPGKQELTWSQSKAAGHAQRTQQNRKPSSELGKSGGSERMLPILPLSLQTPSSVFIIIRLVSDRS